MEITKKFKFELSHRLIDSYSEKCQSIHGHSYICEVTLTGEKLDSTGMLMDFGQVKNKIGNLFDAWDHSFMFWSNDPLVKNYIEMLHVQPLRMIEVDYNPTAENMAFHIYNICFKKSLPILKVRVQETLTGWAVADTINTQIGNNVSYYNIEESKDYV